MFFPENVFWRLFLTLPRAKLSSKITLILLWCRISVGPVRVGKTELLQPGMENSGEKRNMLSLVLNI